jgi:Zn-dependent peptidase ImmA (M78 family)
MKTQKSTSKISFKLPKTVEVKGETYKVKRKKNLKDDDGHECDGLHDHINKEILICSAIKDDKTLLLTFLHELNHAYMEECHLREGLSRQMEEAVAECIAQGIVKHFDLTLKE